MKGLAVCRMIAPFFIFMISTLILPNATKASPLVTNVFYDTDLREALRDISAQTGINIIPDETVQGVVTLEAVDMPLEECLTRILTPLGYTFRKIRDYYIVGAPHPQNPAFPLLTETTLYTPNYLKADDIYRLLSDYYAPYVKLNAFTNTLAITASTEMTKDILEKISRIDVAPKQIMIEAVVTEMSESAARNLGIDWSFAGTDLDRTTFSISTKGTAPADSAFSISLRKMRQKWGDFNVDIMTSLKALEDQGEVEIRANPRLATINGQSASIFIGREEYYSIVTGPISYPYTKLELIQVGISLTVTPYVSDDSQITVDIKPEVSDVTGKGATELPVVSKRSVNTKVRVRDGETITVGGLRLKSERTRRTGIPFLCRIPILGYLFGHDVHYNEDSEIVVFITPKIIED
ncbi:MAG: type II secretion system protein GspD [bacterium]